MTTTPDSPYAPRRPLHRRPWVVTAATGAIALFIGVGIGTSTGDTPEPETRIETITETEEVEVEVPVEVTPQSCLDALDYADKVLGHAGDGFDAAADGFDAASRFDTNGLLDSTDRMSAAGDRIEQDGSFYITHRQDYRNEAP